ncbi:hypothetical protein ACE14D_23625 [Streptomyces sp. Act-28]
MAGSESHESPLERVTGEKDVHPEEERERGRRDDRRERGADRGDARRDASGSEERDTGS